MKYFLIEITKTAEKIEKGVYEYDDETAVIANFHSKMGSAMKNESYLAETLIAIKQDGTYLASEYFERKVVEPEAEE